MTFEMEGMQVIQPLDPYQGPIFTELVENIEYHNLLYQLYQLIVRRQDDSINPTFVGSISWRSIQSTEVGFEFVMEDWK